MRKKIFVFLFLFFVVNSGSLLSEIKFSSRDSTIEVTPGSSFYNNSSNLIVDGSLIRNTGANLYGNSITFSNGYLESESFRALMNASLALDPNGVITLNNGGRIDASPGSWIRDLSILGMGNRIEGQPLFENPITFDTASSSFLTLAIQNVLATNILLNNLGTLNLDDNLRLADNTQIVGPGTVELNNRRLSLGGYYGSPWGSPILWDNATDIVLNGSTTLSNTWTFSGVGRINGNGHVLDLSAGGRLVLFPGATLLLSDVHLRGLGDTDSQGQIVFMDDNGQLRLYNVDIELVRDVTTTLGTVYVEGPTTFILKDNNWTYSFNAKLSVDGVTLWVDTLRNELYPNMGQLCVPRPLYFPGSFQYDILTGILDLISGGTVRFVCDKSELLPSSGEILVDAPLIINLTLKHSMFIHSGKKIQISNNVFIDGAGAVLYFARFYSHDPDKGPQFIVDPGMLLKLRNITLAGITNNTFSFGAGAAIQTEGDVKLELNDDIDFDSSYSWTFSGVNIICGNGHVIDLSNGGKITLLPGAVLKLVDVHIRGLGDTGGKGRIVFVDDSGELRLYHSTIELVSDVSTFQGRIYVEGPTVFLLKDHDWTFSYSAKLIVDGITLWLDTLKHVLYPDMGQLLVPMPVYYPGSYDFNSAFGILQLLNDGTIKLVCDKAECCPVACKILVDVPLTTNLTLNCSRFIHPGKDITIAGDMTLDGDGAILYFAQFFSNNEEPQFIVKAGVTLTLRNITLTGLTRHTFLLEPGAKIIIGENVHFELYDDLTFNVGQIILENQTSGGAAIANVFYVRGMGGRKRFTLLPGASIALGQNTLALQNVELNGLQYITRSLSFDGLLTGAIGLAGDAVVNVEQSTSMAFVVQALGNVFRLMRNNMTFSGLLSFADFGDNVVHFDFVLYFLTEESVKESVEQGQLPIINFGPQFIYLRSLFGIARIIFDDIAVKVNNGINAFIVTDHSFLGCNRIVVAGEPIWNYFDPTNELSKFIMEAGEIIVADEARDLFAKAVIPVDITKFFDPAMFRDFDPTPELRSVVRPMTGLQIERAKEEGVDIMSAPTLIIDESAALLKPQQSKPKPEEKPQIGQRPERPSIRPPRQEHRSA